MCKCSDTEPVLSSEAQGDGRLAPAFRIAVAST
jgi:hypothetical protein